MTIHPALTKLATRLCALTLVASSGCMMWMRDAEFYAEELTELLESRNESIAACYDRVLYDHGEVAGEVVLEFDIARQTGAISKVRVADAGELPEPATACITDELADLTLDPPDANEAHATVTWEFMLGSNKGPTPDPFAGVQSSVLACYSTHLAEIDREAQGVLVVDYRFNEETGALDRLTLVEDQTKAPEPVVTCATQALERAKPDPAELDYRNVAGQRTFSFRYDPWTES